MTHKKGDMLRIHVANEKGGYTAECTADTVNVENLDGIPMNDSAVSEILSAPVSIRANTQIADGEQRMAEFGLAGNTRTVRKKYYLSGMQFPAVKSPVITCSIRMASMLCTILTSRHFSMGNRIWLRVS